VKGREGKGRGGKGREGEGKKQGGGTGEGRYGEGGGSVAPPLQAKAWPPRTIFLAPALQF